MYYLGGQSPLSEVLSPINKQIQKQMQTEAGKRKTQMEAGGNPGQGAANLTAAKKEDTQEGKKTEK